MFRSGILAAVIAVMAATASLAFEIDAMSDAERDIFRSEIRDYLIENPEVLMEAIAVLEERRAREAAAAEVDMLNDNRVAIFNDGYSFVGGNPDGDVTIVEFMDYRCGFCKRAFPLVEELIATDGNIRFIVKEYPILGDESTLASRYAIAAKMVSGDEVYKAVHDSLMLWSGQITPASLGRIGRGTGVDHEAVLARMNDDEVTEIIQRNRALAQALQIQGTPSFVMGENFVRGFVELEQMRAIVAAIRNEQG
ncbi:MAG: DsbA family protein [Silicimonas sp.]|nr:DsbA family protein [Silicimonas sp.]